MKWVLSAGVSMVSGPGFASCGVFRAALHPLRLLWPWKPRSASVCGGFRCGPGNLTLTRKSLFPFRLASSERPEFFAILPNFDSVGPSQITFLRFLQVCQRPPSLYCAQRALDRFTADLVCRNEM